MSLAHESLCDFSVVEGDCQKIHLPVLRGISIECGQFFNAAYAVRKKEINECRFSDQLSGRGFTVTHDRQMELRKRLANMDKEAIIRGRGRLQGNRNDCPCRVDRRGETTTALDHFAERGGVDRLAISVMKDLGELSTVRAVHLYVEPVTGTARHSPLARTKFARRTYRSL
ncbi:MAG: hypothetical protein ABI299_10465 [Rhodanobacter sp.]